MVRCLCHFPPVVSASPPVGWKFPSPRLYSTNEMNQQLPANLVGVMEQRMKLIEQRSVYLQEQINQPDASPEEYSRANRELHRLESTMDMIKELWSKQEEIEGLKSLVTNSVEEKDLSEMAAQELLEALEKEKQLQHKLFQSLLPKDEANERDCILEVCAGTGGEEASLFAMDIFKMYEKYSQKNGWKFDVIDIMESAVKGYKEASGTISGPGAYGKLKFESGIHRVQRVPVTEKSGRVHTSAVSVAILPQADEVDVQLRNEDLRIDTYRSGGSGGQSVNTTDSAVRITHVPTGTVVAIQDERSQHQATPFRIRPKPSKFSKQDFMKLKGIDSIWTGQSFDQSRLEAVTGLNVSEHTTSHKGELPIIMLGSHTTPYKMLWRGRVWTSLLMRSSCVKRWMQLLHLLLKLY